MAKKEENIIEKIEDNIEEGLEEVKEIVEKVAKKVGKTAKKIIKDVSGKEEESVEEVSEEFKKAAEAESLATESIEDKKKKLLEKAKKLSAKVEGLSTEELKEQVKGKKKTDTLLPLEDYVKSGIYLGTRVVTPHMRQYVYRRRADGLAILNTDTIDEKLKEGIEYISKFSPEEIIVVCKRPAGWKAVEMFSKITGIRAFTKKYPAGVLTNTQLPNFFEAELAIITDSWLDKNALLDMKRVNKKVMMIADTNNFIQDADEIVIGNNKSAKSLGLIFYLLAQGYCKARGIDVKIPDLDMWISEDEEVKEKRPIRVKTERVKYGV